MGRPRQICQYGKVHNQCRCRGPHIEVKIDCPTPDRCKELQSQKSEKSDKLEISKVESSKISEKAATES